MQRSFPTTPAQWSALPVGALTCLPPKGEASPGEIGCGQAWGLLKKPSTHCPSSPYFPNHTASPVPPPCHDVRLLANSPPKHRRITERICPFAPVTLERERSLSCPKGKDTGCATVMFARAECVFCFNAHFLGYIEMGGQGEYRKEEKEDAKKPHTRQGRTHR